MKGNKRYNDIMKQIGNLNDEVRQIFDAAGDDALDAKTVEQVKDNNKKIEELEHEAKDILEQIALREGAEQRERTSRQPVNGLGAGGVGERKDREGKGQRRTAGDLVYADESYLAWLDTVAKNGNVTRAQFRNSPAVAMKTLITGASDTSAGALVNDQRLGLLDTGVWQRPLTIRDLVTIGQTTSDTVEFVRVTGATNNAAPVAEATATGGSSGVKPESAITMEKDTEAVKTIAHWIPATRRALADAAQIRTLIDAFLRYGLEEELEDQMLNGDGTGENLLGILNTTGTQTQAYDTSLLTTSRKARTKVGLSPGRARPTAYVFNPLDWEAFDLLKDGEDRYYFGGPSVLGTPRLWGLPVVECEGMTQGVGVVADWRWAVLWDREQAQIMVSDSHSDFFIRNMIAILAEMRAAFTLLRPGAFVEIDLTA